MFTHYPDEKTRVAENVYQRFALRKQTLEN